MNVLVYYKYISLEDYLFQKMAVKYYPIFQVV